MFEISHIIPPTYSIVFLHIEKCHIQVNNFYSMSIHFFFDGMYMINEVNIYPYLYLANKVNVHCLHFCILIILQSLNIPLPLLDLRFFDAYVVLPN